jgi:hypothetical protein
MKMITELDYEILKRIPVYPEEKTRAQIVREIKHDFPDGEYATLTTAVFDASLMKYTKMFLLIEDKVLPNSFFFIHMEKDADVLQSTLEPINLEWVHDNIGNYLDIDEDEIYRDLIGLILPRRKDGWYKQSDFKL